MKTSVPLNLSKAPRRDGFALITVISLMVLISLLAVAMLGLSSITLNASSRGKARALAQANARMAMVMALGELQRHMGPDQRVSANGSILAQADGSGEVANPRWTGVWQSWKAEDKEAIGGYSRHATIEGSQIGRLSPTYEPHREDHFESWLVSLPSGTADELDAVRSGELTGDAMPTAESTGVRLVGAGTVSDADDSDGFVDVGLLNTDGGRYGWWIGDESQKACVMADEFEEGTPLTLAERLFRQQAPGSMGTRTIAGLEDMDDDSQLRGLASLKSLDLVKGAEEQVANRNFHHVTPYSLQVLADVREGGLKRDLTTLLERPITNDRSGMPADRGDEFMLYKFNTKDRWAGSSDFQECVPIQDLAAFYQLHDSGRPGWREGAKYSSPRLSNSIHVTAPDFGSKSDPTDMLLREYTTLYRNPVPIKVQFLLSMYAEPIQPAPRPTRQDPDPDTHKLHLAVTPAVTLWNPTNLPMVMNLGDPNRYSYMFRMMNLPVNVRWNKNNGEYKSEQGTHLTWATQQSGGFKANVFSMYFSGTREVKFEPGEVRVFSFPEHDGNMAFKKTDRFVERHEAQGNWNPYAFIELHRSDRNGNKFPEHVKDNCLTFKRTDEVSFEVAMDNTETFIGSALQFLMIQASYQQHGNPGRWEFRHYQHNSRYGRGGSTKDFNSQLFESALSGRGSVLRAAPRSGGKIIDRPRNSPWPFLYFGLMAGCETSEASNGGAGAGRTFASRPFLHATPIAPSFIDRADADSQYNYGWNWRVEEIGDVFEAPVEVTRSGQGYYGGGFTIDSGATHVVQQEIPIVPPISIASLSSAHLGGFSLATEPVAPGYQGLVNPWQAKSWQRVTATGQAGLFPHTLQAIGNSYAHPHIAADEAYTNWTRHYSVDDGPQSVTLADHSYLANKALWDDFFFSSMTPRDPRLKVYEGDRKSLEEVADEFFFEDTPLPNRRFVPYTNDLKPEDVKELVSTTATFRGGFADQIAGHMMVAGPFNVNSTSVEAWETFLSSLKGKKVSYLDKDKAVGGGVDLTEVELEGVPVAGVSLPNGGPAEGSADPRDPEQWYSWRELDETEIRELAEAMVEQVKLRGPFLSMSDFVNRRLDRGSPELAVKGALQAALDDEDVSINAGFRNASRSFSNSEVGSMNPRFKEALEGPVAYGSAAYVDQADVLRNFASQLTPRGDTFVIRTYGDSLDAAGKVEARAWCEAVVQRVPDYLDPEDAAHTPHAEIRSETNRQFGRRFKLVSFRWLTPLEI